MTYTKKGYSGPDEVVAALRATKSESKRTLLDTAADLIEKMEAEIKGLDTDCRACRHNHNTPQCYETDTLCTVLAPSMTNADLIRAMSDEELASILGDKCICPPDGECTRQYGDCVACWFEYLKQPAKEDA